MKGLIRYIKGLFFNPEKVVIEFLNAWLSWALSGAKPINRLSFERSAGLCANLSHWVLGLSEPKQVQCGKVLGKMFFDSGLDKLYPFGHKQYNHEYMSRSMHRSLKRLQWVAEKTGREEEYLKWKKQ